jgi:hypothetical protein
LNTFSKLGSFILYLQFYVKHSSLAQMYQYTQNSPILAFPLVSQTVSSYNS